MAKDGDCDAQYQVGFLYFVAYGVDRDISKSLELWTSAANRGQPRAQIALADFYFMNPNTRLYCRIGCEGVAADLPAAYRWYMLAGRSVWYKEDKDYLKKAMPHIREALSSEQGAAVEREVEQWKPLPDDCKPRQSL